MLPHFGLGTAKEPTSPHLEAVAPPSTLLPPSSLTETNRGRSSLVPTGGGHAVPAQKVRMGQSQKLKLASCSAVDKENGAIPGRMHQTA